MEIIELYKI